MGKNEDLTDFKGGKWNILQIQMLSMFMGICIDLLKKKENKN
jgi:Na+/H+-dicarboxylate symporter